VRGRMIENGVSPCKATTTLTMSHIFTWHFSDRTGMNGEPAGDCWTVPEGGIYDSNSPETAMKHVEDLNLLNIDVAILDWWGSYGTEWFAHQTAAINTYIGIMDDKWKGKYTVFLEQLDPDKIPSSLAGYAEFDQLDDWIKESNNWWYYKEKPVILLFNKVTNKLRDDAREVLGPPQQLQWVQDAVEKYYVIFVDSALDQRFGEPPPPGGEPPPNTGKQVRLVDIPGDFGATWYAVPWIYSSYDEAKYRDRLRTIVEEIPFIDLWAYVHSGYDSRCLGKYGGPNLLWPRYGKDYFNRNAYHDGPSVEWLIHQRGLADEYSPEGLIYVHNEMGEHNSVTELTEDLSHLPFYNIRESSIRNCGFSTSPIRN